MDKSFNAYIENSIRDNWELTALSDFKGVSYSYKDIARKIEKMHILMEAAGIKKGDKIAICGRNSSHWAVAFFATLTYGAVVVPILHEFKPDNVHHIVNHSEAKLLFVGDVVYENLDKSKMPNLSGIILINDFSVLLSKSKKLTDAREHLNQYFGDKYPERFRREDVSYHKDSPEELALINYTSGSTGFSKGVMLPYRSLWTNLKYCYENFEFLHPGDPIVSMLPMAHMYGLMVELCTCFAKGCHIHFLTRVPSPKIIMDAFAEVKPRLIITVPLIIEKIIRSKIFPMLEKPLMQVLMKIPLINTQLQQQIKIKLEEAFGGNMFEIIIGGAALNHEVENLPPQNKFPLYCRIRHDRMRPTYFLCTLGQSPGRFVRSINRPNGSPHRLGRPRPHRRRTACQGRQRDAGILQKPRSYRCRAERRLAQHRRPRRHRR